MIYYSLYLNKMSKDYSILYELAKEEINEKEVEEKYSEFLDWLKESLKSINEKSIYMLFKRKDNWTNNKINIKFKNIIFNKEAECDGKYVYDLFEDISKYLERRKIKIGYYFHDDCRLNPSSTQKNESIHYYISCTPSEYYLNNNILKIPKLEQKISSLEQTNQDILKKLEEQIELNSKLCQRIFEMKEQQFKDEKIDL